MADGLSGAHSGSGRARETEVDTDPGPQEGLQTFSGLLCRTFCPHLGLVWLRWSWPGNLVCGLMEV